MGYVVQQCWCAVDRGVYRQDRVRRNDEPDALHSQDPDGSKLAYSESAAEDGPYALFVLDLRTGARTKIPGSEGLYRSFWSPNGKFLIGSSYDGKQLKLRDLGAQRWTTLATAKLFGSPTWSPDSHFVYVQDLLEKEQPVHRVNISTLRSDRSDRIDVCSPLLAGDIHRCGLEGGSAQGDLLFRLSRGDQDVYSLELSLP